MQGMSERQYAAHVGLSRGAIQKAKTAERLVLYPDGSINAAASDARRAETTDPSKTRTPPAPKLEPAKPADTGKTGFVVQVGAFADANAATALRDKLRAAGMNAFTDTVNTDGGKRTRVRVGPAMNRAEADALKAQVKAKAGIDGIVRPHP